MLMARSSRIEMSQSRRWDFRPISVSSCEKHGKVDTERYERIGVYEKPFNGFLRRRYRFAADNYDRETRSSSITMTNIAIVNRECS